jgi:hypothetical protein
MYQEKSGNPASHLSGGICVAVFLAAAISDAIWPGEIESEKK